MGLSIGFATGTKDRAGTAAKYRPGRIPLWDRVWAPGIAGGGRQRGRRTPLAGAEGDIGGGGSGSDAVAGGAGPDLTQPAPLQPGASAGRGTGGSCGRDNGWPAHQDRHSRGAGHCADAAQPLQTVLAAAGSTPGQGSWRPRPGRTGGSDGRSAPAGGGTACLGQPAPPALRPASGCAMGGGDGPGPAGSRSGAADGGGVYRASAGSVRRRPQGEPARRQVPATPAAAG